MIRCSLSRGFTLIEILVVLVVVGLLAALAVTNMGGASQQRELESRVRELYLLMQTASEQAILNNQELGLVFTDDGYQFVVFDDESGEWTDQGARLFRPRVLPEWVTITPLIESELPKLGGEGTTQRPDLVFFSSGETTPFELEFTVGSDSDYLHRIVSDGVSPLEWQHPGEQGGES
ncbi:MAG: type II secretion system minor pseudopilin GspH [Marinobacter sp.]|uniref:type II secretion system minor pseudopilin GspH n=1 Tax=Marinobacter sp. TaxID=50741 RepID=UPI00299D5572|nr:type II secretion system minor pseudopilin GspH [Marinobacter sp.]MDX1755555.1 type II secretion system minor pseudopilin GspH [Marinobacter sp.]